MTKKLTSGQRDQLAKWLEAHSKIDEALGIIDQYRNPEVTLSVYVSEKDIASVDLSLASGREILLKQKAAIEKALAEMGIEL